MDALSQLSLAAAIAALAIILGIRNLLSGCLQGQSAPGIVSMAWQSGGSSNAALVNNLSRNGLITTDRVKAAMLGVSMGSLSAQGCPSLTA